MVRNKNTPRMSASHSLSFATSTAKSENVSRLNGMGQSSSSPLKSWKTTNLKASLTSDHKDSIDLDDKPAMEVNHAKQNGSSVALNKLTNCNGHTGTKDEHERVMNLSPASKKAKLETLQQTDNFTSRMQASSIKTNMYRKMFGRYKVGQELLARWSDGLYYIGVICDVSFLV